MERFLQRWGTALFITYMVVALVPLFLYEVEFNAPFYFGFRYLGLPIVAVCLYVYFVHMPAFRAGGELKGIVLTLLCAAMFVLMMGGYVLFANAWGPGQRQVDIAGRVVDMWVSRGRNSTNYIVELELDDGSRKSLEVSRQSYQGMDPGERYEERWRVGTLGLLYRTR